MPRVALCHIIDIIACELVNKKDNIFVLIIPDIILIPEMYKIRLSAGIDFNTCFFCSFKNIKMFFQEVCIYFAYLNDIYGVQKTAAAQ